MCFICERIEQIKNGANPYFVRELETGYVVIGDNQHFRGYTLFLYKRHEGKTELFHLEPEERAKFMEEMVLVSQAVSRTFGAEKMNCELLGNGDAHLHWHLFPRVAGGHRKLRKQRARPRLVVPHGEDVRRRKPPDAGGVGGHEAKAPGGIGQAYLITNAPQEERLYGNLQARIH